jgi:hypothetical protein
MVQKIRLRVIANAILDIRMQSRNMTDQQALDLRRTRPSRRARRLRANYAVPS